MTEPLLSVDGLETVLGSEGSPTRAVDGIGFHIGRGETFALLGESGCGKSMTALSIMRLLPETGRIVQGSVALQGLDLLRLPEMAMRRVRGRRMAMIFQEPQSSLNPVLSIGEQIGETLRRHLGLRGTRLRSRILELLKAVGIPDPTMRLGAYAHQFSGGMKQRIMIAIALACSPQLLIADEPTTALDVTIQAQVLDLLRRLQRETAMAILLITHDLGVVHEMADRVAVMYAGHIVEQAGREEFFAAPKHPYSQKLFESLPSGARRDRPLAVIGGFVPSLAQRFSGCRFAPRCDHAWRACHEIPPRLLKVPGGGEVRCHLYDPGLADSRPVAPASRAADTGGSGQRTVDAGVALLEVTDLKVHFPIHRGLLQRERGQVRAVDGVSLTIAARRTLALVGESGCGKTTVGKGILQLIRPTAGSVRFADEELTRLRGEGLRRRRRHFQIVFQDPFASMNPRMMVGDIVEEGMQALGVGGDRTARRERIATLLSHVGLSPEVWHRYPHEFSGGQRQRLCIARALAVGPRLVVCDEPTSALDVSVQAQIVNLLRGLQEELGLAYLFITHNLSLVEYLAHEVAVMYLGRIVEQGHTEEVLSRPRHPYTRALLSAVPTIDTRTRRHVVRLEGDPPSPANPPRGCHFHPRCPEAMPICAGHYPASTRLSATHTVRCFLYGGFPAPGEGEGENRTP